MLAKSAESRGVAASTLDVFASWVRRYDLTPALGAVLLGGIEGRRNSEIAEMRGVAVETVKKQVRELLKRTGRNTLSDAGRALLAEVVSLHAAKRVA